MARSVFLRRSLTLVSTGMLAGLGLMAVAAPAQADAAPVVPAVAAGTTVVIGSTGAYPGWEWCPYGYYGYWHHEGLLSGLLVGTGYLLGDLL